MPSNYFVQETIKDYHLTFNQKCRDIIMKIFGHEAWIDKNDLAYIKYCPVFDEDVYRLNTIRFEHLALRKIGNPFKWLEFIITAPLELLSYCILHLFHFLDENIEDALQPEKQPTNLKKFILYSALYIFRFIRALTIPLSYFIGLAIEIIRCFLAPVRSVIRPALTTAKNNPRFFAMIVALVGAIALGLT